MIFNAAYQWKTGERLSCYLILIMKTKGLGVLPILASLPMILFCHVLPVILWDVYKCIRVTGSSGPSKRPKGKFTRNPDQPLPPSAYLKPPTYLRQS